MLYLNRFEFWHQFSWETVSVNIKQFDICIHLHSVGWVILHSEAYQSKAVNV